MNFFNVIDFNNAKNIINNNLPKETIVELPLQEALGKISVEDIYSKDYLPPYNRSTVDGYALYTKDVQCASDSIPTVLNIVGNSVMGEMPNCSLNRGEAISIATGAILPIGADCVVMIENTQRIDNELFVYSPLKFNENIVKKGEELSINDKIISKGKVFSPYVLGVLAAVGITKVKVFKPLNISIISTGDELVDICDIAENGKIRDINTTLLATICNNNNINIVKTLLIKDDKQDLEDVIKKCVAISDIVLISGGSSVGFRDNTAEILSKLGNLLIHGISIKPGKPTMVAKVNGKLVFGLAGNPFAASMTLKSLLINTILENRGHDNKPFIYAKTIVNFPSSPGRTAFIPVTISNIDNEYFIQPIFIKSAHIATLLKCDGYVIIDNNFEGINKGTVLGVNKFD